MNIMPVRISDKNFSVKYYYMNFSTYIFVVPIIIIQKFFFINFHTSNAKLNPQNHLLIRAGEGSVKFTLILAEYLTDDPMRSLQIDESYIINICIQQ